MTPSPDSPQSQVESQSLRPDSNRGPLHYESTDPVHPRSLTALVRRIFRRHRHAETPAGQPERLQNASSPDRLNAEAPAAPPSPGTHFIPNEEAGLWHRDTADWITDLLVDGDDWITVRAGSIWIDRLTGGCWRAFGSATDDAGLLVELHAVDGLHGVLIHDFAMLDRFRPEPDPPPAKQRTGLELRQAALLAAAEALIDNAGDDDHGSTCVTTADLHRLQLAVTAVLTAAVLDEEAKRAE